MNENIKTIKEDFEQREVTHVLKPKEKRRKIAKIVDFFITTDSVVAKATFVTDIPPLYVELDWGDGKKDIVDYRLSHNFQHPSWGDSLPPGTYEFYHRYDVSYIVNPNDIESVMPEPQEHVVYLKVTDSDGGIDFRTERINIVPKYRVQFYRLYIGLKSGCDPFYESGNEFSIAQTIDGELMNEWNWNPSNNFFFDRPTFALEGSQITREFEIIDPYAFSNINMRFQFTEDDTFFDDYADIYYSILLINKTDEEYFRGRKEGTAVGDCEIMFAVDYEVNLLVPLPSNPNVIFIKE